MENTSAQIAYVLYMVVISAMLVRGTAEYLW